MKKVLIWLPLFVFIGLILLFAGRLEQTDNNIISSKLIGQPLPQFQLPPASAHMQGLSSKDMATGRPRILNIFASWCVPCAIEAPQLLALKKAGVEIDAIAIRDTQEDVDQFLKRNGNPFNRVGLDARSSVQIDLGSAGVPESFVIDGRGRIVHQHIGVISEGDVQTLLKIVKNAQ